MPSNTVKKSVRFEPEAITILEAYAATHQCTQTEALNAIILASAATQVPPTIATQVATHLDDQWQRSIEVRLAKLEAATQVPPTIATQVPPTIATQVPPIDEVVTEAVEPSIDETLTEVVKVAPTPSHEALIADKPTEPLRLSSSEFCDKFGFTNPSLEYNRACAEASAKGFYTDDAGNGWQYRKATGWTLVIENQTSLAE